MGWRGTVRSLGAALRATEREQQRYQKAELKKAITDDSAAAVAAWEGHLDRIASVHTSLASAVDWRSMASASPPPEPKLNDAIERKARLEQEAYRPQLLDIFRGGSKKIRRELERNVAAGPDADLEVFRQAKAAHSEAMKEWANDRNLASRLLDGDPNAIKSVLEEMQADIRGDGFVGKHIDYHIEPNYLHATVHVHDVDIVPAFRRKQLASGRLSETKMPVGELNERYQDYVASAALKVAGDLLQILPIDSAYVTCEVEMVSPQTGHKEPTPILSVQFVRQTFQSLRLAHVDPSDAMQNFRHAMSFKRNQGFSKITPLSKNEVSSTRQGTIFC